MASVTVQCGEARITGQAMCIILFAYKTHPKYNLILAANRDEYFARPTARAQMWEDAPNILAGRDLEHGGTWLGVTSQGRYAAVTNFRDTSPIIKDAPSRGYLVSDFLRADETSEDYIKRVASISERYNGFNLIAGDQHALYYHSNRNIGVLKLAPGVYGLSNHLLDTPWPKVEKGKQALFRIVRQGEEIEPEAIFEVLADHTRAEDSFLPHTGISLDYERALSSIYISTPAYGTRSSTFLAIDLEERITFLERTFEMDKPPADTLFHLRGRDSVVSSRK